jgi:hypothetical protein
MRSGRSAITDSRLAALPRLVIHPTVGRVAMPGSRNSCASGGLARGHPISVSGASVYSLMAAGVPAGKTRSTRRGSLSLRPAESVNTLCAQAGEAMAAAVSPKPATNRRRWIKGIDIE